MFGFTLGAIVSAIFAFVLVFGWIGFFLWVFEIRHWDATDWQDCKEFYSGFFEMLLE